MKNNSKKSDTRMGVFNGFRTAEKSFWREGMNDKESDRF